jgi:predicted phage terminase large subunit-like protein
MTIQAPFSQRQVADALARQSFFAFTWRVFQTLHPDPADAFIPNWHVEAICHGLDEVRTGATRRLVITVPPRHLKSIATAVAYPAYLLGLDPGCKILVASYALDLARKHSDDFRTILESDWYCRLFPKTRINLRGTRGEEIRTTGGGVRKAVSTGGAVTGFGADYVIVDDLLKAQDAASETERERAKTYLDSSLLTRLNNPEQGRIIAIQQRLHEDDPAGYLLSKGVYRHLNLPAIAEEDEVIATGPGRLHKRGKGSALFPQRFDLAILERLRREMGTAAFNMQYQQNPFSPEGSQLRWEWFGTYDERPERAWFQMVVISWDTGMSADPKSDYSVATTWGFREGRWYLLSVLRDRLDYPDLKRTVLRLSEDWKADTVLIEKAGTGIPLLQECHRQMRSRYRAIKPHQDKEVHFNAACAPIEAGRVLLPRKASWLADFRREMMGFPRTTHDDQADSVSQFLNWSIALGFRREHKRQMRRAEREDYWRR